MDGLELLPVTLTVRDLLEDPELELTIHGNRGFADRPISWVHTSELADPTPFLEGGELLLTTGLTLRGPECGEYVNRVAAAGVSGLGFGVGFTHGEVPRELIAAAAEAGLPLVVVPHRTPFIAISKAVSRALAEDEYEGVRRLSRAQHELARAAGSKRDLAPLIRKLAGFVEGWVALLDGAGAVLHAAPTTAGESARVLAAEAERLHGRQGRGAVEVELSEQVISLQDLGAGNGAVLAVGRARSFGTAERQVINSAASLLILALRQTETLRSARRKLRTGFLRTLLAGEPVWEVLDDLRVGFPTSPVRVLAFSGERDREELLYLLETGSSAETVYPVEHEGTVLAVVPAEGASAELLSRRCGARVGVSEPCDSNGISRALRQAEQAVAAARTGVEVVRFAELAGCGLLELVPADRASGFAASLLAPLEGSQELLGSLREWLARHGQWEQAAGALGVHRHTLRNRIRKVESLLGRDLDQPGVRAELWLALRVLNGTEH
ncbi:PucR family transcriptional regulator [Actinopolyspora saharensis]|uniref:Purine catabolism regulatory protein n=1 Tax=Actinopolyspora saharensis TaxID=995062 RepID=A0A1H1A5D1_9ACTN|nr:PucR family transcriptional regulator [Actinopolyspora saharensis]SDQ34721.1 purine catabolism regulatory protein [Actinopolyspora saharensis]